MYTVNKMNLQLDFNFGKYKLRNFINLTSEEKEMVRNWRNDKRIRRYMYQANIISKIEHINFVEKLKNETKDFYWLVNDNENYIGVIYLNKVDFIHKHAYLGIYANPKLKGVGSILMDCLKKLAFKIAKLHTLKLEVIETNERAIKFYKKHSFKEEGRLKEFVYRDGRWLDVIVMGVVNKNDKF